MTTNGRVGPRWGVKGCGEGCSALRPYDKCYLLLVCFGVLPMNPDFTLRACYTPTPSSIHHSLDLNLILELQ